MFDQNCGHALAWCVNLKYCRNHFDYVQNPPLKILSSKMPKKQNNKHEKLKGVFTLDVSWLHKTSQ